MKPRYLVRNKTELEFLEKAYKVLIKNCDFTFMRHDRTKNIELLIEKILYPDIKPICSVRPLDKDIKIGRLIPNPKIGYGSGNFNSTFIIINGLPYLIYSEKQEK